MKAVRIHAFGDTSVLRLEDVPVPVPTNDDLLIRVMASAVNPIEWQIRSGSMKQALGRDLSVTFGWACAGIVEAVGPTVTTFHVGDEICAYPEFTRGGTHAEFVLIGATQAALKPSNLSFVQASAVPMTSQAAWAAIQAAEIQRGERVLIHGGAGAVGHWLIQLAKEKGAYDRDGLRAGLRRCPDARCRPGD